MLLDMGRSGVFDQHLFNRLGYNIAAMFGPLIDAAVHIENNFFNWFVVNQFRRRWRNTWHGCTDSAPASGASVRAAVPRIYTANSCHTKGICKLDTKHTVSM